MAIFEKLSEFKYIQDDTDTLVCTLENAQNINKHTEYILRVQTGPSKENKWTVSRRYRDFASLHLNIQQGHIDLPLPPKKLIGNMQPSFIAERQIALQQYINEILKYQILALSLPVRRFLDPCSYPLHLDEEALQSVSIALRGDGQYELKGPLQTINWRIRKHYFHVVDSKRTNCLLSWQNYGPDKHLHNKDLQIALKSMQSLSHPFIGEILTFHILESGAFVVRQLHEKGSMRDLLYGTEYDKSYLAKYGNPKVRKPFTTGQIAHYGYQILQALKFLHDKGLPHVKFSGHIHPGNILIENQRALLMDTENVLFGVSSVHRPYLRELRRASSEAIDVYGFGRTLYEMVYAEDLDGCYCDKFDSNAFSRSFDDLESILHLTLSRSSWKRGGATLDELLQHPFFIRALNGFVERDVRGHLKFPLTLKEQIKEAVLRLETRLKTDQKLLRTARREVRIQEILGSDEEMKKQRRRAKRDSMWKSTSSLAETVRSHSASTASSPTPPATAHSSTTGDSGACPPAASEGRGALLQAICSFNKKSLASVGSR
ncbi:PX domain-containing protein kinase-like protein isoform X3 [Pieris rapae]|uniref:PX domain-containing protein kinase-like protein isoform X3 n=1 Tax=Pieris rapae TaxID=64459 RepID=UPI001E27A985|nr:PX domain-containing protein kinase-like protein isoform X3 [Pieris rapae]